MLQLANHHIFKYSHVVLLCSVPCLIFSYFSCSDLSPVETPLSVCDQNSSTAPLLNKERFGFYAPELYSNFSGHLDSLTKTFGAPPAYLLWFLQIDDPFPTEKTDYLTARGIRMVISMNLKSLKIDQAWNDTLLSEIIQGSWDSTLIVFALAASASGSILYLRFGYEMNGDWFSWGGKPAAFVSAWQHAHALFVKAGASNVRWIFAPNVLWENRTAQDDLYRYYPGDSIVDIIGLDGYNYGDSFDQWHSWESFPHIFGTSLKAIEHLGKPIWITEAGCPSDPRRPEWLNTLFSFMDDNPCVEAILWFNAQKTDEPDFRIESDRVSLGVLRAWLQK